MHFDGDPSDDARVADRAFVVKEAVAHLLRRGLMQRKSVFFLVRGKAMGSVPAMGRWSSPAARGASASVSYAGSTACAK
jgi:hypothetical protein